MYEKALELRLPVHHPESEVPDFPDKDSIMPEKFLQPVCHKLHAGDIFLPGSLVPAQQPVITAIPLRPTISQHRRKLARITKTEIDSLSRQGVHIVCSISHESKARTRDFRHAHQPQWKRRGGRDEFQRTNNTVARGFDFPSLFDGRHGKEGAPPFLID